MRKHSAENERIKREYLVFLREAKRQDEATIDVVAKALSRFEEDTNWRNFKTFHAEQAVAFKKHLAGQNNQQTGKPLSKATMNSTLRNLKAFFQWLAMQPGYKSRVKYTDAEYFNLSEKDARVATAKRQKSFPTVEQVKQVIAKMPRNSGIERRNQALLAFTLLTGARDSAIASLKLKHIDMDAGSVFQDARDVKTKASKTFTTYFFPVGEEIHQILREWVDYLKEELLFGLDDPLFPKTEVKQGARRVFEPVGLLAEHWSNATPIRKVFKEAFEEAGFQYFNPHSLRNTLVQLGERVCSGPEEFKAWSQNLGHSGVMVTFSSYGDVQQCRQREILTALQTPLTGPGSTGVDELMKGFARDMKALIGA